MPRDEQFGDIKGWNFSMDVLKAVLHSLIPSLEASMEDADLGFKDFASINDLFNEGIPLPRRPQDDEDDLMLVLPSLLKPIIDDTENVLLKFDPPDMFKSNNHHLILFLQLIMVKIYHRM